MLIYGKFEMGIGADNGLKICKKCK